MLLAAVRANAAEIVAAGQVTGTEIRIVRTRSAEATQPTIPSSLTKATMMKMLIALRTVVIHQTQTRVAGAREGAMGRIIARPAHREGSNQKFTLAGVIMGTVVAVKRRGIWAAGFLQSERAEVALQMAMTITEVVEVAAVTTEAAPEGVERREVAKAGLEVVEAVEGVEAVEKEVTSPKAMVVRARRSVVVGAGIAVGTSDAVFSRTPGSSQVSWTVLHSIKHMSRTHAHRSIINRVLNRRAM